MSDDVERICRQCPEDRRHERRVMLQQEAPDGKFWYLCIQCWVDWDRDERAASTKMTGVFLSSSEANVSGPPVASPTIPLTGGESAGTKRSRGPSSTKPKQPRRPS